jgi:hypothetical protein
MPIDSTEKGGCNRGSSRHPEDGSSTCIRIHYKDAINQKWGTESKRKDGPATSQSESKRSRYDQRGRAPFRQKPHTDRPHNPHAQRSTAEAPKTCKQCMGVFGVKCVGRNPTCANEAPWYQNHKHFLEGIIIRHPTTPDAYSNRVTHNDQMASHLKSSKTRRNTQKPPSHRLIRRSERRGIHQYFE